MGSGPLITEQAADFRAALPDGGVLLALDLGTQTIGTALCDAGWRFATPGKTLPRGKFSRDLAALEKLVKDRGVGGLVLGLPRNMDGSEGPRCQSVRQFGRNLLEKIDLPLTYWDERLSTSAVDRSMLEADLSRKRRGELVDKLAAAFILQGALDFLRRRREAG